MAVRKSRIYGVKKYPLKHYKHLPVNSLVWVIHENQITELAVRMVFITVDRFKIHKIYSLQKKEEFGNNEIIFNEVNVYAERADLIKHLSK
jgi:hypothetical protein